MADDGQFSTESLLEITVSEKSLKGARDQIEERLGSVSVDVGAGGGGGGDRASRERALSRQILTSQDQTLTAVADSWEESLELDQRRNDLLRELLESTEKGNFTDAASPDGNGSVRFRNRGGGGGGGGAGGAAVGAILGLLGLGVGVGSVVGSGGDSSRNPRPSDVPDRYPTPGAFGDALKRRSPRPAQSGGSTSPGAGSGTATTVGALGGAAGLLRALQSGSSASSLASTASTAALTPFALPAMMAARQTQRGRKSSKKTWWERIFGNPLKGKGGGGMTTAMMGVPWAAMGFPRGQGQGQAAQKKQQQTQSQNVNVNVTLDDKARNHARSPGMADWKVERITKEVEKKLSRELKSGGRLTS